MTSHVLSHVLPSGHPTGPRRSTPPSPEKATHYRRSLLRARASLFIATFLLGFTLTGVVLRIAL